MQRAIPKPRPVPPPVMRAISFSSVNGFVAMPPCYRQSLRTAPDLKRRRVLVLVHDEVLAMAERFRLAGRAAGDVDDQPLQFGGRVRQGALAAEHAGGVE